MLYLLGMQIVATEVLGQKDTPWALSSGRFIPPFLCFFSNLCHLGVVNSMPVGLISFLTANSVIRSGV